MHVVGCAAAALAHVPLVEVGDLRGEGGRAVPVRLGRGRQRLRQRVRGRDVGDVGGGGGRRGLAVHLHVLAQRARVRVGLVAAAHFAVVGLVAGVHVRVLLPVAAVGEFSVAAVKLALERLLPFEQMTNRHGVTWVLTTREGMSGKKLQARAGSAGSQLVNITTHKHSGHAVFSCVWLFRGAPRTLTWVTLLRGHV